MTSTAEGDEAGAAAPAGAGAGHEHDPHAAYEVGRLLAFSDGVFAIAITLLVLGIPVPNVQPDSLVTALEKVEPNLVGFALSFILVGTQWITHHRLLRQLNFCNGTILWINLLLLMGICLVPFATSVLVKYGDVAAGAIPYGALQAAIGAMFVLLGSYLKRRGLQLSVTYLRTWIQVLIFLVSLPLALWRVDATYAVWVGGFLLFRVLGSDHFLRWTRSRS
jgi:uncharacterized membrane protein